MTQGESIFSWLLRLWRHLWQSERAAWQAVPNDMAERLTQSVQASEQRHSGQIRICVEGALPLSYVWRAGRQAPLPSVVRQRAMAWFGRLQVWDTEHNNGVLIYLLLTERRIEIVADRGLTQHTQGDDWLNVMLNLRQHLQKGDFETGLTQALDAVSALLCTHCPHTAHHNELPDPIVRA
jgi:hypothetical protein